jgi:hypothetical protein
LHSKTMNRFQMALLEHDFIIQYKKRSNMPADYLFRLPTWTKPTTMRGTICQGHCHLKTNGTMATSTH